MSHLDFEEVREILNAIPNRADMYPRVEGDTLMLEFDADGATYELGVNFDSGHVSLYNQTAHETVYKAGGRY